MGKRWQFFRSSISACMVFLRNTFLAITAWLALGEAHGASPGEVRFGVEVRPLLSHHCVQCHGPDEAHREAKLRLDTEDGLFGSSDDERIVVPGQPDASLLYQKITAHDPDDRMPPPESKKVMSADEIAAIRRWIEQGAEWEGHWSFVTPQRPGLPSVQHRAWPRNAIDFFTLARMEANGLEPSPEVDRRTLIRRVCLDLTGLPPSPEAVERFVNDTDPNAYEMLVDSLLASERYGERMTLAWMDAARYGDSSVFHDDGVRFMWPWRDWVIRAYNDNKRFDEFTVEQLAGDQFENATLEQKVASGFNRNHGTTDEGGLIEEEYRVEYNVDRVKTTSNVWLGLTMECAQCHDHKYDPISQKEYYQFYAYFNINSDAGNQTRNGNSAPMVKVPSMAERAELQQRRDRVAAAKGERAKAKPSAKETDEWIADHRASELPAPPTLGGWHFLGSFTGKNKDAAFKKDWGPEKKVDLAKEHGDKKWEARTYEDGKVHTLAIPDNSAAYLYRTVTSAKALEVMVSLGSDDAIKVFLNGKQAFANNTSRGPAPDQDKAKLALSEGENHLLLKIVNAGGPAGFYFKLGGSALPENILALLAEDVLSAEHLAKLQEYYEKSVWPLAKELNAKIKAAEKAVADFDKSIVTVMTMGDLAKPRKTYVLERGHYGSPRKEEEIFPGVPVALPPLPDGAPSKRIGLAKWIADDDHPLTARVAVNRYWSMIFGKGLVTTVMDFGTRGALPSHPRLLDWLARDFADGGWNVKRVFKQMLMSSTYRQQSAATAEQLRRDPENVYLSRAPRLRLQGEFIRDNALAVSGVLNDKIGGPSVKPYQPPRIWNEVALNGGLFYKPDKGAKLYRRSMYTYWKRSAPMPSMMAFDAPTREKCVVQRPRTNTPMQALVTLNDVQFVEAARLFAQRVLQQGGADFDAQLDYAMKLTTARPADELRRRVFRGLYDSQLAAFRADAKRAGELLKFGEAKRDESLDQARHAAWTTVASAILNLDEVITRE